MDRPAVTIATAFDAHTRAGHASVGDHASGLIAVGAPATYAIWAVGVTDADGHRYLDLLAGYSALNFGHRHPTSSPKVPT